MTYIPPRCILSNQADEIEDQIDVLLGLGASSRTGRRKIDRYSRDIRAAISLLDFGVRATGLWRSVNTSLGLNLIWTVELFGDDPAVRKEYGSPEWRLARQCGDSEDRLAQGPDWRGIGRSYDLRHAICWAIIDFCENRIKDGATELGND